ncbi:MAG TPA: iron-sulfur cluster repair di-iron protein [Thermoanaerobaculia bacterium]|nr:iron-sulfur cluster repair di-iron protein [Thermoanaerobaculia bacterium]
MSTTISLQDRTVGELAAEMPVSIRVFESWKIDYCCGGGMPLADACARAGKSVDDFAAAIAGAAVVPEGAARDWSSESLTGIATHICDTYHRYTREELATLQPIAEKVLGVHGARHDELAGVLATVLDLANDMLPHMLKEEQVLFPYVQQLEDASDEGRPAPTPFFGTVRNPVRMMMLEHDRVGELLARLRSLTDDYTLPHDACFSYRELYRRLAEFEERTHEHVHIENNVYFPRAIALEEHAGSTAVFAPAASGACGCSGH